MLESRFENCQAYAADTMCPFGIPTSQERSVPGALGVGDGAALGFHDPHICGSHQDDQVHFDITAGVVVQAQAGDDNVAFA